jgi:hypothetical protein
MTLLAVVLIGICYADNAYAYIDPGTGSVVLQALIAGFLGVSFAVKLYWRKLVKLVTRRKDDDAHG